MCVLHLSCVQLNQCVFNSTDAQVCLSVIVVSNWQLWMDDASLLMSLVFHMILTTVPASDSVFTVELNTGPA